MCIGIEEKLANGFLGWNDDDIDETMLIKIRTLFIRNSSDNKTVNKNLQIDNFTYFLSVPLKRDVCLQCSISVALFYEGYLFYDPSQKAAPLTQFFQFCFPKSLNLPTYSYFSLKKMDEYFVFIK